MQDWNGKVAVITGGGRGIGRGIALRCAKEGMKVVLAGYGMESITKTAADLEAMGTEVLIVQTDVSDEDAVNNLADKSFEHFDEVHLLVNNAGVGVPGSTLGVSIDDWKWVLGVNFYGVLYCVRAFAPRMKEQDFGHIVNVSSISGLLPGSGAYSVSKHAVVSLSESLYNELADTSIGISVYCPAWVNTEIDKGHRSRPERFADNTRDEFLTEEWASSLRNSLDSGYSIEKSADVLFEGLAANNLYIGVKAFTPQLPNLPSRIKERAHHIVNEVNP